MRPLILHARIELRILSCGEQSFFSVCRRLDFLTAAMRGEKDHREDHVIRAHGLWGAQRFSQGLESFPFAS